MQTEIIAALATIIITSLIGTIPLIVIVVIVFKVVRDKNRREADLIEKGMEIHRLQAEKELPNGINPNRIVRCRYCGRQNRYNQGICKCCGANLEYV